MHKPPSLPLGSTKTVFKIQLLIILPVLCLRKKTETLIYSAFRFVLAPQFIVAHSNWYQLIKVKIQTVRTKL